MKLISIDNCLVIFYRLFKAAEDALKKSDLAEASKLINKSCQQVSAKAKDVQIWSETKKRTSLKGLRALGKA